ncbi:small ribosomal subunit protein uS10m-like [Liolophura sinensis]|uniref:small ribosomal subunit protein uS10m-like n=1 Tax=Liolophura sinensis TaxID=3198878 RepID=UPI0031584B1B
MAARTSGRTGYLLKKFVSLSVNSSKQRYHSTYQVNSWLRTLYRTTSQQTPLLREKFPSPTHLAISPIRCYNSSTEVENEDVPDDLYRQLDVEVKGHEPAVLDSYQKFVTLAAQELEIEIGQIFTPPKIITRRTLLKSVHIFKKHRVQYEWRTHFRVFEFKHLTGSTADTFLEYIQRNLPEGVAMKVSRYCLEEFPDHIADAIKDSRSKPKDHYPPLS